MAQMLTPQSEILAPSRNPVCAKLQNAPPNWRGEHLEMESIPAVNCPRFLGDCILRRDVSGGKNEPVMGIEDE